jgi:predicted amidohydrolase
MAQLTVALVQERAPGGEREALEIGTRACEAAAGAGADVVLFPELWQTGYAAAPDDAAGRAAWQAQATDESGAFVSHFRALARRLEVAVVITYLERTSGAPHNTAALIDRTGAVVLTYAKVHTCDFCMEAATMPGAGFDVAALTTAAGEVRIGLMICYDREFPEAARALMLDGAEIVLVPNACPLPEPLLRQFRTRAMENMVGMAMANYAADGPPPHGIGGFDGHSIAVSSVCFDAEGGVVDDLLIQAGEQPGLFLARFDLDELRAYRRRETWGDAYRKPWAYGRLVTDAPVSEFERADSRRAAPARAAPAEASAATTPGRP